MSIYSLHTHELNFSAEEVVLNPEAFPWVAVNDIIEIIPHKQPEDATKTATYSERAGAGGSGAGDGSSERNICAGSAADKRISSSLFLQVSSLSPVKVARMQISLLKHVAEAFGLHSFQEVVVRRADPKEARVDFVELTFKDEFISRADMWRFKSAIYGKCAYIGQNFNLLGIRARVKELSHGEDPVFSGVLHADTKMTFRSRSARIFWLVQMSYEMWDYAPDGEVYYEKFLAFARILLDNWRALDVSHSLSVVFFTRMYYNEPGGSLTSCVPTHGQTPRGSASSPPVFPSAYSSSPSTSAFAASSSCNGDGFTSPPSSVQPSFREGVHLDSDGRVYKDFYKMVLENECKADTSTGKLLWILKREFISFARLLHWRIPLHGRDRYAHGVPAKASKGNFLEAINVTLNVLEKHYMDRDLTRTGNSIVMISPSSGVIEVDVNLSGITKQRMMDNGIGMDMLSLSQPPLHTVPLFIARDLKHEPPGIPSGGLGSDASMVHGATYTTTISCNGSAGGGLGGGGGLMAWLYEVPHWMHISYVSNSVANWRLAPPPPLEHDLRRGQDPGQTQTQPEYWEASETPPGRDSMFALPPLASCLLEARKKAHKWDVAAPTRLPSPLASALQDLCTAASPPSASTQPCTTPSKHPLTTGLVASHSSSPCLPCYDPSSSSPYLSLTPLQLRRMSSTNSINHFHYINHTAHNGREDDVENTLGVMVMVGSPTLNTNMLSTSREATHVLSASRDSGGVLGGSHGSQDGSGSGDGDKKESDVLARAMRAHDTAIFNPPPPPPKDAVYYLLGARSASQLDLAGGFPHQHPPTLMPGGQSSVLSSSPSASPPAVGLTISPNIPHWNLDERTPYTTSRGVHVSSSGRHHHPSASASAAHAPGGAVAVRDAGRYEGYRGMRDRMSTRNAEVMLSRSLEEDAASRAISIPRDTTPQKHPQKQATTPQAVPQKHMAIESGNGIPPAGNSSGGNTSAVNVTPPTAGNARLTAPLMRRAVSAQHRSLRRGTVQPITITGAGGGGMGNRSSLSNASRASALAQVDVNSSGMVQGGLPLSGGGGTTPRSKRLINPFRSQEEAEILKQRTHNHRRWSHVFPPGEVEFKHSPGPNWKSLCQPAILPLTTDYLPSSDMLTRDYTESFYGLTLPDMDDPTVIKTCKSHADFLQEMVCQRLTQDFQIVEKIPYASATMWGKMRGHNKGTVAYILSMGHRIHVLSYDEHTRQVDVKRFLDRHGSNTSPANHYKYSYLLWVPQLQRFQTSFHDFYKFPQPEYRWNYVDELVCGYYEELKAETKYRRKLYAVSPDDYQAVGDVGAYLGKVSKLLDYLNSRRRKSSKPLEVEVIPDQRDTAGSKQAMLDELTRRWGKGTGHSVTINIPVTQQGPGAAGPGSRHEWLLVTCDKTLDPYRAYHIEVHWLVCSARNVSEFIQGMVRKCQQLGLTINVIPEYSRSPNLNVHPFIAHPFIACPTHVQSLCEQALVTRFGFVGDDERHTEWSGMGVAASTGGAGGGGSSSGIEDVLGMAHTKGEAVGNRESALTTCLDRSLSIMAIRRPPPKTTDRQYFHRSGFAFVRVAPTGFVWVNNRLLTKEREREPGHDQSDGPTAILKKFEEYCTTAAMCHSLVEVAVKAIVKDIDTGGVGFTPPPPTSPLSSMSVAENGAHTHSDALL